METLNGWAVPLEYLKFWDHTYVLSSDGYKWPCWGRDAGGKNIASGSGDSSIANCLSQINSHAGIEYGVTGVCHQTANRILYPAGITVSAANGYGLTFFLYGTWGDKSEAGRKSWEKKKEECLQFQASPLGREKNFTAIHENFKRWGVDPMALKEDTNDSNREFRAEFEALIQTKLGRAIEEKRMDELCQHAGELHVLQTRLRDQKWSQSISPEDFAAEINQQMNEKLRTVAKILTAEEYFKLFDVKPGVEVIMVDAETLKEAWSQENDQANNQE